MNKKLFHCVVATYCIIITALLVLVLCDNGAIFNRGYNSAIKDAQLIEVGEDTYYIQFGNDIHEYSFD